MKAHFNLPYVLYAGSYEGCGCGFNYGREDSNAEDDKEHLIAARESLSELVQYVRSSGVRAVYSCSFGHESKPKVREQTLQLETLSAEDFIFREGELINIACETLLSSITAKGGNSVG